MRRTRKRLVLTLGSCILVTCMAAVSIRLNTDLSAPPRFDGAGYAVLGESLVSGRGYREINEPDSPRHDHFPPGYPAALALIWWFTGLGRFGASFVDLLLDCRGYSGMEMVSDHLFTEIGLDTCTRPGAQLDLGTSWWVDSVRTVIHAVGITCSTHDNSPRTS